ncbi:hypothetical protein EYC80_002756 [Monilinia laxa]|uniref:Uncharacterized protein n=1 Tax=Monilinia laxa TaxID=61186 RepID=A0A5N6KBN2_MONLA|nr:hypothetical protein EYC80_002756 [Monilinia laxa]
MSYNTYNPFLNPIPLVPCPTIANGNGNEEGSQNTASTLATPIEPQEGWPARSSQEEDGLPQSWNPSWNPLQNLPSVLLSSNNVNSNMNVFETAGYAGLPNVAGLGIDSGFGQHDTSQLSDAALGDWPGNISGSSNTFATKQEIPSNNFINDFGFDTPTPFSHPINNQSSTGDSGASVDPQFPHDVGSSALNTSTQLASGVQDAEAPQQNSIQQGVQHTIAEGYQGSRGAVTHHSSSGSRSQDPNQSIPPSDAPQSWSRRQSPPQNQRRGLSTQKNPSQSSLLQASDPLFPSRLNAATAALADVTPATQFMESLSSMHIMDRMACVDVLMRSELFKDYFKPHLWAKFEEGLARGARLAARSRLGMNDTVDEMQRKNEGHTARRKVEFQDKQVQNERRLRERAGVNTSEMMTGASETSEMASSSNKRRRQVFNPDYSPTDEPGYDSFSSNSDLLAPSRQSPKKPRHLSSTPSELVNKFCSVANIGNRNPFFNDTIHKQLRSLNTAQLIDLAPEYTAQHGKLSDTKVEHWRACAGQAAGFVMRRGQTCKHCADHMDDGSVPFASCVVIDDALPVGRKFQGACMNCVYLGNDQQCSLRHVEGESSGAQ